MSQRGRGLSKHYWTTAQDDALVDSLYELSQNPMWRVDCGFKTGYLNQLESMLELKIPGCGLKASPHIESRVKYFKLKHNVVADMLALSGFGWDSEKSMIVCDKSVYDEYVKKRKDASGLFLKPFPHYYTLSEIFGRDRANGANAGNADDDEEEVRHEDNFNFTLGNDSTHETFMENILDDMSHTPQSHAHANENESIPSNSSHPKKKRRTKDKTFENMSSNMGAMADSISAIVPKLDGLISVLSTADKELSDLQAKLYGEICKIEGLGEQEILDVIDILATKHDMLRVFFNLPNELKKGVYPSKDWSWFVRCSPCISLEIWIVFCQMNTLFWNFRDVFLYNIILEPWT